MGMGPWLQQWGVSKQATSRSDIALRIHERYVLRRHERFNVHDAKVSVEQRGQTRMRPGHVNAQHGRVWPCPRDSRQDTSPGIVWRPCSNWSEGAGLGRVDRPCAQAHVSIAHDRALSPKPERHRALLVHPEGMVLWTLPPADLG